MNGLPPHTETNSSGSDWMPKGSSETTFDSSDFFSGLKDRPKQHYEANDTAPEPEFEEPADPGSGAGPSEPEFEEPTFHQHQHASLNAQLATKVIDGIISILLGMYADDDSSEYNAKSSELKQIEDAWEMYFNSLPNDVRLPGWLALLSLMPIVYYPKYQKANKRRKAKKEAEKKRQEQEKKAKKRKQEQQHPNDEQYRRYQQQQERPTPPPPPRPKPEPKSYTRPETDRNEITDAEYQEIKDDEHPPAPLAPEQSEPKDEKPTPPPPPREPGKPGRPRKYPIEHTKCIQCSTPLTQRQIYQRRKFCSHDCYNVYRLEQKERKRAGIE